MMKQMAYSAKEAGIQLASLPLATRNDALKAVAEALRERSAAIFEANQADLAEAEKEKISPVLQKRLRFDDGKLAGVIAGIESLIAMPDPLGRTLRAMELDQGLELYQVTCPIGVLGIVFESRPDALVQISSLALKSGNAVLLKGGREASRSNRVLSEVILEASLRAGLPAGWLGLLETRDDVKAMLAMDDAIDLVIPRGSNSFVQYVMAHTKIPVLGHADGICHVYVDREADLAMAERVAYDSKCQYAAVCNAMETLLVHRDVAERFLPRMKEAYDKAGVVLRGDETVCRLLGVDAATEKDWQSEYNDLELSIRVVDGLEQAIEHINRYGSGHTDAIVTRDETAARRFMALVDSANVFWNCSTRYSDGYRYGLGAEVGISTNKIHSRGPVGMEGLLIYKWKLIGRGQVVSDYSGEAARSFTHRLLEKDCPMG